MLDILDEPSIGSHQRDNRRLLETLIELRDLGNTVIVVEHDRETDFLEEADFVVDLGPGAGKNGGEIVAIGPPSKIKATKASLTGQYLSHRKIDPKTVPQKRRKGNGESLRMVGATGNNLKEVTVEFPLGVLTCITGVSGSGKSTLVNETLYRICAQHFFDAKHPPLAYKKIEGLKLLDKGDRY